MMPYALRQVPSFSSWYREKKSPSRGECLIRRPLVGANTPTFVKKQTNVSSLYLLECSMNALGL